MIEPVWSSKAEIEYNGKKVGIKTIQREILSNGWIDFGVKSDDNTFIEVFGKNPISIAIKPKQEFKAEFDLFQNTPEQVALAKEIWQAIQKAYF
jgi:hypothetical protein